MTPGRGDETSVVTRATTTTTTTTTARTTAILIVGHGSREERANLELEALVACYRALAEQDHDDDGATPLTVAHAYVELARPLLDQALASLAATHERIVVIPLFLFLVGHAKNDVPIALARARAAFPHVDFVSGRELGVHPTLLQIAFDRAAAAACLDATHAPRTALVVVGRGSGDPAANAELYRLARLLAEGRGLAAIVPCFIGITAPLVPEALETAARGRPEQIIVLPYFLFAGRLADRLTGEATAFAQRYPWIRVAVARHLGPDPRLAAIIAQRVGEALQGRATLPCDTCQYRAPIAGVVGNVGGQRALLWSLRHSWSHGQAAPHRHAHRALAKHVLVCGNVDCAASGSIALLDALRRVVKDVGRQSDIRVTRTSCMGRCGEGPTVAVYPDGIWYRQVRPEDADEVVREHLLGDRLVTRLVDNIMQ